MTHKQVEDMAVRLVALPEKDRLAVLARVDELTKRVRAVGKRLKGRSGGNWGDLMLGGIIYDEHGNAMAHIAKLAMRSSVDGKDTVDIEAVVI